MTLRRFLFGLMAFLAIGVSGYALWGYAFMPLGSLVHPDMRITFEAHYLAIYAHVFGSIVALALGPFQFWKTFRERRIKTHRLLGKLYLGIGILIGGLAGLSMAFYAFGGIVAKTGFGGLAVAWLFTGGKALSAVRAGNIVEHQRWMIRNYALTLAAVSLRIYLPLSMVAGIDFTVAYPAIAWLCWVPNILSAEWLLSTSKLEVADAS